MPPLGGEHHRPHRTRCRPLVDDCRKVPPERRHHRVGLVRPVHLEVGHLVGDLDVEALVSHGASFAQGPARSSTWARRAPSCPCPPHLRCAAPTLRRSREDFVNAGTGPAVPTSHHHEAHDTDPHGPLCGAPGGERLQCRHTRRCRWCRRMRYRGTRTTRPANRQRDEEPTTRVGNPTRVDGPQRLAKVALRQFDECGAFLDYVHTEAARACRSVRFRRPAVLARHG